MKNLTRTKRSTASRNELKKLRSEIHIKGARSNNLKNIELRLPKNKLIVFTGLSGSGKSSLVMDTIFAEGQRRYVESLSSYARQFLNRMKKPEVDFIKGICPAIAIEQKRTSSNARSTVGSLTEIYDYLRLLFARIGKTISPVSGKLVKKHEVYDVVDYILSHKDGTKIILWSKIPSKYGDRTLFQELNLLIQKGFTRIRMNKETLEIEQKLAENGVDLQSTLDELSNPPYLLIDRVAVSQDEENQKRVADSVLTAFNESEGECLVEVIGKEDKAFNNRFELDGLIFLEPTHQLFNYNNPYGACTTCEGYGRVLGIDPQKVIPNELLSVYDGAVACWKGEKFGQWKNAFVSSAQFSDFPVHRPVKDLTAAQYKQIWEGGIHLKGINDFFSELEEQTYKIQNRVMLARYRGRTVCPDCHGGRLRKEARYVKIDGYNLPELINLPIYKLHEAIKNLHISDHDRIIAKRILFEISNRLQIMVEIGLDYLTLDRVSSSLSGGETQRINLTRTLGSNLTNSLYILDEPSIGLHPRDTQKLVKVLKSLRDLGNTVIVVEHEEEVIRNADYIVDIGPLAGIHGGEVVYAGPFSDFVSGKKESLTSLYLSKVKNVPVPERRRTFFNKLIIHGARQHNLNNIDVTIPLNCLTVISGVSGSGKTSLVKHILFPALKRELEEFSSSKIGKFSALSGDLSQISSVEFINQNPIGKSSRSNPITYVKAYDSIRKLFSNQQLSKIRGYKPKHFSFNVEGGRCETCQGEGEITIEMQFLADVKLRCEDCGGKRFKKEVLEVKYQEKDISQILNLSIDEAIEFFKIHKDIVKRIEPLQYVGLGYVKLGQSSSTLSGGEAQRVKLASFIGKNSGVGPIFFIFDEPTTGLHFHDIRKLLDAFNALVENGHTVLVVEHNLELIKSADWLIDLGPGGGNRGGNLIYQGKPEGILSNSNSYTAEYLSDKLN